VTTASVVVPAYNEESGVRRCLETLLSDATPGEFEVIVVANGCRDRTAEVARGYADRGVRCIETEVASKANALNLGDGAARDFPRIFLDADVAISTAAARAVADALRTGDYLAAAPRIRVDATRASRLTRAYVRVWQSLPVLTTSYVGSGCYAVSAKGRERFDRFPDMIGDDKFINELFLPEEKLTLAQFDLATSAPRNLRAVIRRSLRVRAGRLQLEADRPRPATGTGTAAHLRSLARQPSRVGDLAVFVAVQVIIAVAAKYRRLTGRDQVWLRDETSRS